MQWRSDEVTKGVRERRFELDGERGSVPGLLWLPEDARGVRPLVGIGHGASGSKREGHVLALARRLVRHHGFAAVAIDGPVHGDRRHDGDSVPGLAFLEFSQLWAADPGMTDAMVSDWLRALDAVQALDEVGPGPVGWWGLSMGTIIGLPLVATGPRFSVAVLGLMGLTGPTSARIAAAAAAVTCPVLFVMQWHDELFSRVSSFELFDALATTDKRLHANPGRHSAVPPDEFGSTEAFLAERLVPRVAAPPA